MICNGRSTCPSSFWEEKLIKLPCFDDFAENNYEAKRTSVTSRTKKCVSGPLANI